MAPKQLTPWLNHVKKFQKAHPTLSYKTVLKRASKTYHSKAATKKTPVKKRTTTKKRKTYPNGRPYLTGAAWRTDHYSHNASEPWEVPRSRRKIALWN
jgi:hypothetical protein